ncbi:hypothetical protein ACFLQ2_05190 [archaeon]
MNKKLVPALVFMIAALIVFAVLLNVEVVQCVFGGSPIGLEGCMFTGNAAKIALTTASLMGAFVLALALVCIAAEARAGTKCI